MFISASLLVLCRCDSVTSFKKIWNENIVVVPKIILTDFCCMVTESCTKDVLIMSRNSWKKNPAFQTSFFVLSFFIRSTKRPSRVFQLTSTCLFCTTVLELRWDKDFSFFYFAALNNLSCGSPLCITSPIPISTWPLFSFFTSLVNGESWPFRASKYGFTWHGVNKYLCVPARVLTVAIRLFIQVTVKGPIYLSWVFDYTSASSPTGNKCSAYCGMSSCNFASTILYATMKIISIWALAIIFVHYFCVESSVDMISRRAVTPNNSRPGTRPFSSFVSFIHLSAIFSKRFFLTCPESIVFLL